MSHILPKEGPKKSSAKKKKLLLGASHDAANGLNPSEGKKGA